MTSRKILALMAALVVLAMSSIADAGIVDPAQSSATIATTGIMTIAPGGADGFTIPINRRIDVYVNDSGSNPVEIIASDIWLNDDLIAWCAGGVVADSSTFSPDPGHTTFTGTPRGGVLASGHDCANISIDVIAVGNVIESLSLAANSPDLNGSGGVDIIDFSIFGTAWQTDNACANLDESLATPTVDIIDFSIFGSLFNVSNCP